MKNRLTSYLILLNLIILISCDKEEQEPTIRGSTLEIGNYSNMNVIYYDTLIRGEYNITKSIDLDLDQDNLSDIRLTSAVYGSPGQGLHPNSKIMCLNANCLIKGYLSQDTTYYKFQKDTTSYENSSVVYINTTRSYSCDRKDDNYLVYQIRAESFKIDYMNSADSFSIADIFAVDTITLSDIWTMQRSWGANQAGDTVGVYWYYNYLDCNSFPSDIIQYIGFEFRYLDTKKLGWIKLSLIENYKPYIYETAIQK